MARIGVARSVWYALVAALRIAVDGVEGKMNVGTGAGSAADSAAAVVIDRVCKRYPVVKHYAFRAVRWEGPPILDNISLNIKRLEFVSIVGTSGGGKTTLLRIMAGLTRSSSGDVWVDSEKVMSPRAGTAMVFQSVGLLEWRTVRENAALGLQLTRHQRLRTADWEVVDKYLELVGLSQAKGAYPHQLSGGMQQRVGIARALVTAPDLLLMDEPFGALDAVTRRMLQEELLHICEEYRATVVFVTHDIEEAILLSDRVVVIGGSPGVITDVMDVELPRPRYAYDARSSPEFNDLRHRLWTAVGVNGQSHGG